MVTDAAPYESVYACEDSLRKPENGFHLRSGLQELVRPFEASLRAKGLDFELEISSEAPAYVRADEQAIFQILSVLLHNAYRYTDEGLVRMVVSRAPRRQSGPRVRFAVADTGIGVADDRQERLFDGAAGKNLLHARELTERLRGRIGVLSEKGLGSTFWFDLPL